jgi:hypothetical protein
LEGFAIWQNLNNRTFTVNFTTTTTNQVSIDVFDICGRSIFTKKFDSTTNFTKELNLSSAAAGLYMVRVNDGERVSIKKIIIQ